MVKLSGRERSELLSVAENPGIWRRCAPEDDTILYGFVKNDLVKWIGRGRGFEITDAGRSALNEEASHDQPR